MGNGWISYDHGADAFTQNWETEKAMGYAYTGTGTVSVPNIFADGARFRNDGATVRLGGSPTLARRLAEFHLTRGVTTLDASRLHVSDVVLKVEGDENSAATLVLTNGAQLLALEAPVPLDLGSVPLRANYIGSSGKIPSVLEINEGCAFTGRVYAADWKNTKSVFKIRGGEFVLVSGPTADGYMSWGEEGYCYINQTGGKFLGRAHTGIMRGGSTGIYHLRGGEFGYIPGQSGTCNFTLSRGDGMGILHQTGGVHNTPNHNLYMGIQDYSDTTGGLAVATLDGPNALI